jgi:hypothetical protein
MLEGGGVFKTELGGRGLGLVTGASWGAGGLLWI